MVAQAIEIILANTLIISHKDGFCTLFRCSVKKSSLFSNRKGLILKPEPKKKLDSKIYLIALIESLYPSEIL